MNAIITIALNDLRSMLRQRTDAFFIFIFPVLYALFFTVVLGGGGGKMQPIKLIVVDEDDTAASHDFVAALEKSDALKIEMADRDTAHEDVRTGKRVGYVLIEKGFGLSRESLFAGDTPTVQLGIDPARPAEIGLLQGLLNQAGAQMMQSLFNDGEAIRRQVQSAKGLLAVPGGTRLPDNQRDDLRSFLDSLDRLSRSNNGNFPGTGGDTSAGAGGGGGGIGGMQPLRIKQSEVRADPKAKRSPATVTLPQGIVWALLACAAAFGTSLVSERTRGTLVRLRTSPISPAQILAGKGLACFITLHVVAALLLTLGAILFGVVPQSFPMLLLALACSGVWVVGLMMLLSVLGKTESASNGIAWGILLVLAMIGGAMVPAMFMPAWMQEISNFSPVKWSILAIEGALWRGYSLADMARPCVILVGSGVATFVVGAAAFRWHSD
ncbi:MAG: ABC transporter permease [Planctomycetota bacterium]